MPCRLAEVAKRASPKQMTRWASWCYLELLRSWNVGEEEAPNIDVARLHVYGTAVPGLVELLRRWIL